MAEKSPATVAITGQHLLRQIESQPLVRRFRDPVAGGEFQTAENAVTHLGRRLVGESERQHLFRILDHGQQAQVTLCQQLGLAGAGRGLDDEGGDLDRPLSGQAVFFEPVRGRHYVSARKLRIKALCFK
jgi:hypothetical protein